MPIFALAPFLLLFIFQCEAQTPVNKIAHSPQKTTFLLDSATAAQVITQDAYDRFFDRVTPCEMSIQMKQALGKGTPTERAAYQAFLQSDMDNFTASESRWVASIMQEVFSTCQKFHSEIMPDSLLLIKTKGNHYGDGVYYTRGNCIVIPADVLRKADRSAFKSTMYHEVFHVYSRLNPNKRNQLYQLIGFEHIGLDQLDIPSPLKDRVLYNPDGVDFGKKINLRLEDGSSISAIPIIYSNADGYQQGKGPFFSYLEFNLFQVQQTPAGRWQVLTKPDGLTSWLSIPQLPDFFRQIKDNTSYIIHPDEVLADNFSFLMLDKDGKKISSKFSPEGKELLEQVKKIITAD